LAIPACAVAAGIAIQAVGFGRAPEDTLVATAALRGLDGYRVMRSTETLAGQRFAATCIQGRFRLPRRRLAGGALVLLGNGERLFDVGSGIRRLVGVSRSRPAGFADRVRFVLAGCPHYLGDRFATDLVRGRPVEAVDRRSDGESAAAIVARSPRAVLTLATTQVTHRPLALSFSEGRLRGTADLVPGGGWTAIRRVRRAFGLAEDDRGHA
jgi:hypothetical protein